jgi:predicted transcriptional regulator
MTVEEIAAWLGIARSTAQRYLPPDALVRIGLVKRSQSGNAHVYRSTLRDHLAKEFPGGDQEALLRRVLGK